MVRPGQWERLGGSIAGEKVRGGQGETLIYTLEAHRRRNGPREIIIEGEVVWSLRTSGPVADRAAPAGLLNHPTATITCAGAVALDVTIRTETEVLPSGATASMLREAAARVGKRIGMARESIAVCEGALAREEV